MAHALFAPSSAATWLECSFSARNSVPEAPKPLKTQLAADEGTRRHEIFSDAVMFFGELPPEDDPAHAQTLEGLDFLCQLEPGELHSELKVELSPECGGTADIFNKHSYIATVLD